MSYIPSDFDNLEDGFNILDIKDISSSNKLVIAEGSYEDKGLGYKQSFSLHGSLNHLITYPNYEESNMTIDFCWIFKNTALPSSGSSGLSFNIKRYNTGSTIDLNIDLVSYTHTVMQDSNGNEVWLYENFPLNSNGLLYMYDENEIFAVSYEWGYDYLGPNNIHVYKHFDYDLSSFNRNGISGTLPAEQQLVIKWINDTIISNFSIARKSSISDIMEVSFDGTFDNTDLGTGANDITQISINFNNPETYQSEQLNLIKDVDYTVSGNTFYSGTGSSASTIEISLAEMFPQGITFIIYTHTTANYKSKADETFENKPVFNWGNDNNTKFFNVNGEYRINGSMKLKDYMLDIMYPIGSLYLTNSSSFNPNNSFYGTWSQLTGDAYLKIVTSGAGSYGGTSSQHKIPVSSLPSHSHSTTSNGEHSHTYTVRYNYDYSHGHYNATNELAEGADKSNGTYTATWSGGGHSHTISNTGGDGAYYPYYYGVYVWIRTA